jgi:serine protein kinase
MRSIEEKIDIPESRKDDFRREIMNYIGALAIDGKTFDYRTNERLHKALELKLFEDQKDTIKLTSLVSTVVDKDTQEKIDVVKQRLIRDFGYTRFGDRRAELRRQHLRPRRRQGRAVSRAA